MDTIIHTLLKLVINPRLSGRGINEVSQGHILFLSVPHVSFLWRQRLMYDYTNISVIKSMVNKGSNLIHGTYRRLKYLYYISKIIRQNIACELL